MSIETYPRKKLEIIIDEPHLPQYVRVLEQMNLRGYTVLESKSGKGSRGAWAPARLSNVDDRVMIVAVMDDETCHQILVELQQLFQKLPGVAFVSEVAVLRSDRF